MALTKQDLAAISKALKPHFDRVSKRFDRVDKDLSDAASSIKASFNDAEENLANMETRLTNRLNNLDSSVAEIRSNKRIRQILKKDDSRLPRS